MEGHLSGHIAQALAASLGGAVTGVLTHPTDTLKTQQILYADRKLGVKDLLRERQLQLAVVRSLLPNLVETTVFVTVFDLTYSLIRAQVARLYRGGVQAIPVAQGLLIGAAAGAITQVCSCPLKVVALGLQTEFGTISEAARGIYARNNGAGLVNFFKGLQTGLVISSLNPAIDYEVFGRIARLWMRFVAPKEAGGDMNLLSPLGAFLLGLCSKIVAATITYPINTVKLLAQMAPDKKEGVAANERAGSASKKPGSSSGAMAITMRLYGEGGLAAFYAGYKMKMLNTGLKGALRRAIMARVRAASFVFVLGIMQGQGGRHSAQV